MEIQFNTPEAIDLIKKSKKIISEKVEKSIKSYEKYSRLVFDYSLRPNKKIKHDIVVETENGEQTQTVTKFVDVARLSLNLQNTIIKRATSIMLSNPIKINSLIDTKTSDENLNKIKSVWFNNKLDFRLKECLRQLKSKTESALLVYLNGSDDIKVQILDGNFYPYFDFSNDLVAFGREFVVTDINNVTTTYFDIYTKDYVYAYKKIDTNFVEDLERSYKTIGGKIPIVYFTQDTPDYFGVQEMIDRLDTLVSNFSDTNDYFGNPILVARGNIQGFATKGEQGKIITTEENADVSYLTWNNAPESIKLEIETLKSTILTATQTVDTSFEAMRGIGDLSGIALKLLFMDSHLKAKDDEETFGVGVQRLLNIIKTMLFITDVDFNVYPEFTPYMPSNELEMVNMISTAVAGGFLSKETAVRLNPLVNNADVEIELLKVESIDNTELP